MDTPESPSFDPHPLSPWVIQSGNRNRDSLLAIFRERLPSCGRVLELGSGRGMHVNYFAREFLDLEFQPSDRTDELFAHIEQESRTRDLDNVMPPVVIDLLEPATWRARHKQYRSVFCINVIHVAPLAAIEGIAHCAASCLLVGGTLTIFGAFTIDGQYPNQRSKALDSVFRARGVSDWGYKDTKQVIAACKRQQLGLRELSVTPEGRVILGFCLQKETNVDS